MPDRWKRRSRWKTATRSCVAARRNLPKASGPSSRSESLSISGAETRRSAKDKKFWETQNGWKCGGGDDETGFSQGRMAGARHRGRAARRRHRTAEVTNSAEVVRGAHPGLAGEMGERSAGAHLARAARRSRSRMAQGVLW